MDFFPLSSHILNNVQPDTFCALQHPDCFLNNMNNQNKGNLKATYNQDSLTVSPDNPFFGDIFLLF